MPFIRFGTKKYPRSALFRGTYGGQYVKALRAELNNAFDNITARIAPEFAKTTSTWDHEVNFEEKRSMGIGDVRYQYGTKDKIYKYVDQGVEPHPISPKSADGKMFFIWAGTPGYYTAKTTPRVITSGKASPNGNVIFNSNRTVNHPGIEARDFSKVIREQNEPYYRSQITQAFSRWVRS